MSISRSMTRVLSLLINGCVIQLNIVPESATAVASPPNSPNSLRSPFASFTPRVYETLNRFDRACGDKTTPEESKKTNSSGVRENRVISVVRAVCVTGFVTLLGSASQPTKPLPTAR